ERAFGALAARHPALRTTFPASAGSPLQRIHPHLKPDVAVQEAGVWSEAELRAVLDREASRPFALEEAPAWRARLWACGGGEHVLLLVFHHLISDFWTIAGLLGEL
ncbi:MAG TPA: hypothetical protein DD490_17550, partial [Acidobacteria bacterium]|nr:hypothetical protein [Acidobacteriota bacterium]